MQNNHSSRVLSFVGLAVSCVFLLSAAGCNAVKNAVNGDGDMRQKVVASGLKSCLASAHEKGPLSPAVEAKMNQFCSCFSTKGLEKFTNTELIEIGMRKDHSLTPAQKEKQDQAVLLCEQDAGIK